MIDLQVQRREVESHLQSAVRLHLNLTCGKLNNVQEEFKETTRKLEEKYEKVTRKIEEKFEETKRELEKQKEVTRELEGEFGEAKRELEKHKEVTKKLEEKFEEVTRKFEDKVSMTQFPEEYTWEINRFSKVQNQAKKGEKTLIRSPPFYYFGYKFRLGLHPNGNTRGKDTHLSLYFQLMKGECDAKLSWPFQGILKFKLIDQQEDADDRQTIVKTPFGLPEDSGKIFNRPLRDANGWWGMPDFVPLTKLKERRYIVDGTIVIQVQVTPE